MSIATSLNLKSLVGHFRSNPSYATYVAQLGDNVVIVEGNVQRTGGFGKDIYIWNMPNNNPVLTDQLSSQKLFGFSVKISTRWLPSCNGTPLWFTLSL